MKKLAFLFAGQGAQAVGMGQDMAMQNATAKAVFDMGDALCPGISEICFTGDGETLNQTQNTQPCLFLTDLAIAKALRDAGVVPDAVAGFSLGEIPALAFAKAFSEEEAFRFVLLRGKNMGAQSALHPGGMVAALKLGAEAVNMICTRFSEVWPVNYNCPGQICCAGSNTQLDDFCNAVKEVGGRAVKLPVSGAFHTPYMQDVATVLRDFLENGNLQKPAIPVYANRTAAPYPADHASMVETLSMQVCSPVKWENTLHAMFADGIDTFVEVGAGSTLTGFVRRTLPDAKAFTVNDFATFETVRKELAEGSHHAGSTTTDTNVGF